MKYEHINPHARILFILRSRTKRKPRSTYYPWVICKDAVSVGSLYGNLPPTTAMCGGWREEKLVQRGLARQVQPIGQYTCEGRRAILVPSQHCYSVVAAGQGNRESERAVVKHGLNV